MWELDAKKQRLLALNRLQPALRRLGGFVLDFVYPPTCVGCGVINGSLRGLCPKCWATMRFIEQPYCPVLGLPFPYEQPPGTLSLKAISEPPEFDRLRSVAIHDGVARSLVHGLKYRDRLDLASMMAAWMARAGADVITGADVILPVPLHRRRLFSRRFNQSAELARALARQTALAYLPRALVRVKPTARQVGLGRKARLENVRSAFKVPPEGREAVFGKRIVLVDDVYTTGATANAAARALKRAGAREVSVLTFAMAVATPI